MSIKSWICERIFGKPRTRRVELRCVDYTEGDRLVRAGWELAIPEEDYNLVPGMVWLERREASTASHRAGKERG